MELQHVLPSPSPNKKVIVGWEPIPGRWVDCATGKVYLASSQELALDSRANHTLYTGSRGPGKALPLSTLIPTPNGFRCHGDLKIGDEVYSSDGLPIKVQWVGETHLRDVYRLCFDDGTEIEASDHHLWQVSYDYGIARNWRVVSTKDIVSRVSKGYKVQLPKRPSVQFPYKDLGIDPYMLGAWLGDGSTYIRTRKPTGERTCERKGYVVEFGSKDNELIEAAVTAGFAVRRECDGFTWLCGKEQHKLALMALDLFETKSHTKFIPEEVLTNSIEVRLAVLQGLADTDGTVTKTGSARISTVSEYLAYDVAELVRSLGGRATVKISCPKENARQKQSIYYIQFSFHGIVPFRLTRKVEKYKSAKDRLGWFLPKLVWAEAMGQQPVSCIMVDSIDHLYLASRSYIVTHNTDAQIMRFARRVEVGYGSAWRGVIFDRKYKNLDDLIIKSKKWFPRIFGSRCRFLESKGDYKWVWDSGEELLFRVISKVSDYDNYHGHEYPFIGWNELTKFPNSKLYDMMMSCNRSSWTQEKDSLKDRKGNYLVPPIPRDVFSTCNSKGVGHRWVKERFIDVAPYGQVVRKVFNVFNPRTQMREDYTITQITIFGSYRENPHLDPGYIAELESEKDVNTRKSWLEGSWDIVSGGALDDVWNSGLHRIPRFPIPSNWYVDRSFDWGSTKPFSVGWWAEANGEEVTLLDGRVFAPVRGTLIRIYEWYGSKPGLINTGLKMSAADVAKGIREIEVALMTSSAFDGRKWIGRQPAPGPADNQIGDDRESDNETIKDKMEAEGVTWTKSNKSPGSRKIGLQLLRDRLEASSRGEGAGFLVMDCCPAWLSTVPILERDEEDEDDVDSEAEDHPYDETRYRVLAASSRAVEFVSVKLPY